MIRGAEIALAIYGILGRDFYNQQSQNPQHVA